MLQYATATNYFPAQNCGFPVCGHGLGAKQKPPGVTGGSGRLRLDAPDYPADCFSIAWPILMMLSAINPSPTQRFIPASPPVSLTLLLAASAAASLIQLSPEPFPEITH
jgi:hypothetical protein